MGIKIPIQNNFIYSIIITSGHVLIIINKQKLYDKNIHLEHYSSDTALNVRRMTLGRGTY